MNDNFLAGVNFLERYHGVPLYSGILDNNPNLHLLQQGSAVIVNTSVASSQKKRDLIASPSKNGSLSVQTPGYRDYNYDVRILFEGVGLTKQALFTTLLRSMFKIGLETADSSIGGLSDSDENIPAWFFASEHLESTIPLQAFQLLAIVEAIARHCVQQDTYRELIFDFYADGIHVAEGCVTTSGTRSLWCRGLRNGHQSSHSNSTEVLIL